MTPSRLVSALSALLLAAGTATAQAQATAEGGAWVSYRDAYRAMVVFDKYGKAKNLIQDHLQVMPRDASVSLDGVRLDLAGSGTGLNLPLDGAGRAVFPLLKAAYDGNAILTLNRPAGQYLFRRRVSIAVRADGVYDGAELRAACEQVLSFERYVDRSRAGQCVGVRFAFTRAGGEPGVRLRKGDGALAALPATDGAPFPDDPDARFKIVDYRFGAPGQVLTRGAPVAIAALIE